VTSAKAIKKAIEDHGFEEVFESPEVPLGTCRDCVFHGNRCLIKGVLVQVPCYTNVWKAKDGTDVKKQLAELKDLLSILTAHL
jgi:hypothetical protein